MLKNKGERKTYLLNEDNWSQVYQHPSIFTTVKQMVLPDGTIIIRESVLEYDEFNVSTLEFSKGRLVHTYRIVRTKYVTFPLSITFLVEYMRNIKLTSKGVSKANEGSSD